MRSMSEWLRGRLGFVAGFTVAALLFGGLASAADIIQKDIRVSYLPLRYVFDGEEKAPPADQQGFTYNGRTYVPLRFMADSMGKAVAYDAETYTIYMGARPSAPPAMLNEFKRDGDAVVKSQFFESGVVDINGKEMPRSLIFTAYVLKDAAVKDQMPITYLETTINIDKAASSLEGSLYLPVQYLGHQHPRSIAKISFLNDRNEVVYDGPPLTGNTLNAIPFKVDTGGRPAVRMIITIYEKEGWESAPGMLLSQFGISDLRLR